MPDRDVILLRVAEIFLKGQNRRVFYRQFVKNARALLSDLEGVEVEPMYLRAAVHHPPALRRRCVTRLGRLFGLASMSPAVGVDHSMEAFADAAVEMAHSFAPSTTFKIETRRRDKRFPMTSPEISRQVGARVVEATGLDVDVRRPGQVIRIEIGPERCFVFGEVIPGPGGLPIGTAGNVTLLLSGGIDSPVAGWYAMRRGCRIEAVYFHSFPYTGDKTREKVLDVARRLACWQGPVMVHVVGFTDVQKRLRAHGDPEYAVLLYRRMMMRTASLIGATGRSRALITGENLGQVSSQTLENLGVIEEAASLPVLRPLVTFDKAEIVARAQEIGTYEISIRPYDDCCSLFVPKHPATRARLARIRREEEGLDVAAMATALAENTSHILVTRGEE